MRGRGESVRRYVQHFLIFGAAVGGVVAADTACQYYLGEMPKRTLTEEIVVGAIIVVGVLIVAAILAAISCFADRMMARRNSR